MSHGVADGRPRPKADDFARAVARMAVAQICESAGFDGFKESALDAVSDIAIRFLCDLGKTAAFYANSSGRTQCNIFDIIRGFEDIGSLQGFSGGSSSGHCLVKSELVKEIVEFVGFSEEIPFAQPVPRFPLVRDRRLIPSFLKINESPPGKHIPPWLPALPDPHTYVHTPMWNERTYDPREEKMEQARQRRKAERALLNLQQRLISNGSPGASPSSAGPINGDMKGLGELASNQFIAAPVKLGENDVSEHVLPYKSRNHVSVVEAFAPAIEASKEVGIVDNADSERKWFSENRPAVSFKFRTRKKLLGESLDLSLVRKGWGRTSHWLGRDEERDDKKRKAENILRQSMENPQELIQL